MRISRLILKNWRNFTDVDVPLRQRMFILGNNGLGKSNLLDALRFLRDVAKEKGGGLQYALDRRGGIANIRSLFTRQHPIVEIGVDVVDGEDVWEYRLAVRKERDGVHRTLLHKEVVKKNDEIKVERPDDDDKSDTANLTQTALEQTKANKEFRRLVDFFQSFHYLHMVPQLIRNAGEFQGIVLQDDPYGQGLINNMSSLNDKTLKSRLNRISEALQKIKPQFGNFEFHRDRKTGQAHLQYRHQNWRKYPTYQNEQQLSDGELRLIGLLWTLLEGRELIMLEEPEISFNEGIVNQVPAILAQAVASRKKKDKSQIIITTHSKALLADKGIDGSEVLSLTNTESGGGSIVELASDNSDMANELKAGLSVAHVVLPYAQTRSLSLF